MAEGGREIYLTSHPACQYSTNWLVCSMSYPVSKKGEQSREIILDAAMHVIAEKGFQATTVQDLLGAAHVTKGRFFHHFESKDHLFGELLRRALSQRSFPLFREVIDQASESTSFGRLLYLLDRLIVWHSNGLPEAMRLCVFATFFFPPHSPEMKGISEKFSLNIQALSDLIEECKTDGYLPVPLPTQALALLCPSVTVGGNIVGYLHQRKELTVENLTLFREMLVLLSGLRGEKK